MPVALRSHATATAASGNGTKLSADSQAGDVAVLVVSSQLTAAATNYIPSGWNGTFSPTIEGTTRAGYIASRKIDSPSDTVDITWWNRNPEATSRQNATLLVFSGAEAANLTKWQATPPTYSGETYLFTQTHAPAGMGLTEWNTTPSGEVIVSGLDTVRTDASWSAMRGIKAPAGSTPTTDNQGKKIPDSWAAFTVSAAAEPVPANLGFSIWSGTEEKAPKAVGVMPYGAPSVAELLKRSDFVVAHRGGSVSWNEHTEKAYTNAVAYGVDALEISCARSTGGVWFGLHDKSFERLGGPSTPASEMNWADIQSAMKGTNFMPARLDWLLEKYGSSHVIVFDPKYEAARTDEYLKILAPYKDRVILKFSADASWLFDIWKKAGFTTWGYAYGAWKTEHPDHWTKFLTDKNIDILSFEWSASKALWDEVKATGKPITSHIPSAKAQVNSGKTLGAIGTITSAPADVLTRKV